MDVSSRHGRPSRGALAGDQEAREAMERARSLWQWNGHRRLDARVGRTHLQARSPSKSRA